MDGVTDFVSVKTNDKTGDDVHFVVDVQSIEDINQGTDCLDNDIMCASDDSITVLKQKILHEEEEIGTIFSEIQAVKQENVSKQFLIEKLQKKIKNSESKMSMYQRSFEETFQHTKKCLELQHLNDSDAKKMSKFTEIQDQVLAAAGNMSGAMCEDLASVSQCFEQQNLQLMASIQEKQKEIAQMKQAEAELQQTIKIIHKRNAAQLLRLKCLLNEAQFREQESN